MQKYLNYILNIGVSDQLSIDDTQRVRIVNGLNLITALGIFLTVAIIISTGLYEIAFLHIAFLIFLVFPIFLLQYYQKHIPAKFYFLFGSLLYICIVSVKAYQGGRFTETENLILGYVVIIVILFDKYPRLFCFCFVFTAMFVVKAIKFSYIPEPIGLKYVYTMINTSLSFLIVYSTTSYFKNELERSKLKLTRLNHQLAIQNEKTLLQSRLTLAKNIEIQSQSEEINIQNENLAQQQQILSNQKIMLRGIIDNLPLLVAMLDREGNYLIANKMYEELFKIPISEIEGSHYSKILPKEILDIHLPLINKGLKGENADFVDDIQLADGKNLYSYGKYNGVRDENGHIKYLIVFVVDITRLREAEIKLQNLNKMKDKLFSIIAHDLRSPLGALSAMMELVEEDMLTEKEIKSLVTNLSNDVNYTSRLVDNLLYWAKGQIHQEHIDPSNFEIQEIVAHNLLLLDKKTKEKNIKLTAKYEVNLSVCADKNTIDLVLRNLMSNALKFTPQNGEIQLLITKQNNFARVSIQDSGIGISKNNLNKILAKEMFTTQGTQKEKGTGLGLMLCKEFIEKNGGSFWIESEEGLGSTFSFTIPLESKTSKGIDANKASELMSSDIDGHKEF